MKSAGYLYKYRPIRFESLGFILENSRQKIRSPSPKVNVLGKGASVHPYIKYLIAVLDY